ncbi:MAG TPA: ATP-binding protein [Rhizomicrobium sp.]|nr:ATP-binding protein [Rhizomicrobium sp.]
MGHVTFLWSLGAGVALTLAAVSFVLWLTNRRDPASLMLFIIAVAAAASAYLELRMLHSADADEYGAWLRLFHIPGFLSLVGQVLFVYFFLRTGRLWLATAIIAARSVVLVVNFSVLPNFNFSHIASLRHEMFLGEQISTIGAAASRPGWRAFALVSLVLMMVYYLDAAVRQWRMGGREARRKALVVLLGIVLPAAWSIAYTQLIIFGVIHAVPLSSIPMYFGALVVLVYELGRDFLVGRRAAMELAKLQSQFAQMERASMLGQLTSAITHELAQPMGATVINAYTALHYLEREDPDIEKLRAILQGIRKDCQSNVELLAKLRQMFKSRPIEMRPLEVKQIILDVVRLISSEASAKKVSLSLAIQPDLPLILGDRVHLVQVLLNLLMNSIQALQVCAIDARRIVVEARADDMKGQVEVIVRDFGHGIPDDIVSKVFAPFFTTKADGMGVGLTLSRTIVEAHGGNLWADQSAKQEGAIFHFTLQQA